MKCKRTSDGRAHDHHTLQVMRQQAIKAVREGQTVSSVAADFGVNERSVFRRLVSFVEGGQNALLARPISGRPSKLSAEQMAWIARTVHENTPQQLKFEFGLWTLTLIRHLIYRQFGVQLSTAVQRFVAWYNTEHRHSGIGFVTPAQRHAGLDRQILADRTAVYEAAKQANPARWRSCAVRNWTHIDTVWLNPEKLHQESPEIIRRAA